ncbi:MAG TPA: hypothetical protein VMR62_32185 [Bryobacteraceae bacterium]|jgi:CTP:molybdopterin cytidylyltransferase MocA|nr:hypothetical protein [Bryobacteraceae bacterium]
MRTTLTIEPDVAQKIRRRMAQEKRTLKQVVNEALRVGLSSTARESKARFKVEPHSFGFKPGIDPNKLNQLIDDLEAEEFLKKMPR